MISRASERWNIFARGSTSTDGVAGWVYNNCSLGIFNYGKYGRTYIGGSSANYGSEKIIEESKYISEV